jgi:UDP-N-acetylglucosamine acyltransferase
MGAHAMTGFQSHVSQDVPPYMMVDGNPLTVRGFNSEGLRRRGFSAERIAVVKQMHRLLFREGLSLDEARARIAALGGSEPGSAADVALMNDFLAAATRGIAR